MMVFNLTPSNSPIKATTELGSLKRSAKAFSLKKPSLNFRGATSPRRSHDSLSSNSAPSTASAPVNTTESPFGDDVICISREGVFGSSSTDDVSPDEPQTPSASQYASSSSSSSYHLPPETDDQSLSPVDEALGECDPRRKSQLSMTSSWVDHHLQELDLCYEEDGVYEIEFITNDDGFLSRKDSFILPPGETFQSYQQKRNLPDVPAQQFSRLGRPLPSTPPASPGFNLQSRRIRPLPPPPSP